MEVGYAGKISNDTSTAESLPRSRRQDILTKLVRPICSQLGGRLEGRWQIYAESVVLSGLHKRWTADFVADFDFWLKSIDQPERLAALTALATLFISIFLFLAFSPSPPLLASPPSSTALAVLAF